MRLFEKTLSIISSILGIAVFIPIILILIGSPKIDDLIRFRMAEISGVKGWSYYQPVKENHDQYMSWLLVNKTMPHTIENVKRGDILYALHDVSIRVEPTRFSRKMFFVQKGNCVIVLDGNHQNINEDHGGWVKVATTKCQ